MSSPRKTFQHYPQYYFDLLRQVRKTSEVYVEVRTFKRGKELRNIIYGLRNKMYAEPNFEPELTVFMPRLVFRLKQIDGKIYLHITIKDPAARSRAVIEHIKQYPTTALVTPAPKEL